jgi:hypothetical protein
VGGLKVDAIKQHRLAGEWNLFKQVVTNFLDLFKDGSQNLLQRIGLLGDGKLAQSLKPQP